MVNWKGLIGRGFRPQDFGDDVGTLDFTDWPAAIRRYAQHFRAETEPVAFDARGNAPDLPSGWKASGAPPTS